jgi:hypothetical protein
MRTQISQQESLALDPMIKGLIKRFPQPFHQRFADEISLTISDMEQEDPSASSAGALKRRIVADLILSLVREHIEKRRKVMNKKRILFGILGAVVLGFWIYLLIPGLARFFLPWNLKDPYLALLGENPSQSLVILMDIIGYLGPLLALAFFFFPIVDIRSQSVDGTTITLHIQSVGKLHHSAMILSAVLCLAWFILLIASRF